MNYISLIDLKKIFKLRYLVNTLTLFALVCGTVATDIVQAQKTKGSRTIRLLTRDGKVSEGRLVAGGFTLNGTSSRAVSAETLLSINLAADASPREAERITAALAAVQGTDRVGRDTAVADLRSEERRVGKECCR